MREEIFHDPYILYIILSRSQNVYLSHGRAGPTKPCQFGGDSYIIARKDPLERKITRIVRFDRPMRGTKEKERAR